MILLRFMPFHTDLSLVHRRSCLSGESTRWCVEFTIGQYNDNGNYMLHLEKNPVICNIAVVHHRKSSEYEFNNTGNFYNEIKSYWNIGKKNHRRTGGQGYRRIRERIDYYKIIEAKTKDFDKGPIVLIGIVR